jgi:rSAM/selenodomain-associated transferase 1
MNHPSNRNANCLLFFVKYPQKGQVKTRLSAELDEDVTVGLYRNFILDLLSMLKGLEVQFQICFSPADSRKKFEEWLGTQYSYVPQQGDDLGQRMKNAFTHAFDQGFQRVVTIGSDSPDLPGDLINEAFLYLETQDAVIGPSTDGGYYLIGFNEAAFLPEAFEGIEWSTDLVLRKTLSILGRAGLKFRQLPVWKDVDTLHDLKDLVRRSHNKSFSSSRTMSYIHKNYSQSIKFSSGH